MEHPSGERRKALLGALSDVATLALILAALTTIESAVTFATKKFGDIEFLPFLYTIARWQGLAFLLLVAALFAFRVGIELWRALPAEAARVKRFIADTYREELARSPLNPRRTDEGRP